MDWASLAVTYVICWWVALLMVAPIGIDFSDKNDGIAYRAAPRKVDLKRKLWLTSVLAIVPAILLQRTFNHAIEGMIP